LQELGELDKPWKQDIFQKKTPFQVIVKNDKIFKGVIVGWQVQYLARNLGNMRSNPSGNYYG